MCWLLSGSIIVMGVCVYGVLMMVMFFFCRILWIIVLVGLGVIGDVSVIDRLRWVVLIVVIVLLFGECMRLFVKCFFFRCGRVFRLMKVMFRNVGMVMIMSMFMRLCLLGLVAVQKGCGVVVE